MNCEDELGINPLPRLISFMPSVAKLVLDRCVKREGHPECEDFAVTYTFKYMDPHPMSLCCKDRKAWYANVSTVYTLQNTCLFINHLGRPLLA